MLFFRSFYSLINVPTITATTVFNIDDNNNKKKKKNVLLSSKSAFKMISEGSCDTEDWSNDPENSALTSQE